VANQGEPASGRYRPAGTNLQSNIGTTWRRRSCGSRAAHPSLDAAAAQQAWFQGLPVLRSPLPDVPRKWLDQRLAPMRARADGR